MLAEANGEVVDFLSLDVEGYEGSVIEDLDFERICPRFILVEVGEDRARQSTVEQVISQRYELIATPKPLDLFYALRAE